MKTRGYLRAAPLFSFRIRYSALNQVAFSSSKKPSDLRSASTPLMASARAVLPLVIPIPNCSGFSVSWKMILYASESYRKML